MRAFARSKPCFGDFEQFADAIVLLRENRHFASQANRIKIFALRGVHHIQNRGDCLRACGPQAGIGRADAARALEQLSEIGGEPRFNHCASAALGKTKRNIENRIGQQPRLMRRRLCCAHFGQCDLHLSRLPQRALHRSRKPKRIRRARSLHGQCLGVKHNCLFQTRRRLNLRRRVVRGRRSGTANSDSEC